MEEVIVHLLHFSWLRTQMIGDFYNSSVLEMPVDLRRLREFTESLM